MSPLPTLVEVLAELPDPRDPRGRIHPLVSVLSLAIVATLSGCRSLAAISQFGRDRGAAFAHALGFRRGKTPAPSTLSELFRDLDAEALDRLIGRWLASRHAAGWDVVTLDGKTVRGSRDGDDAPAVHLLAAYAPQAAAVIGQLRVDAKTNEHKAALRLLGVLPPLGGAVVTADAMFTHRDVAEKVRENQGHYLLPVKDNQATLLADLTATFAAPATFSPCQRRNWDADVQTATTRDKGHGRIERRTLTSTTWLNAYLDWPGVAQVFRLERERRTNGNVTVEVVYGITSLPRSLADAARLLTLTRDHWGIENRLHYIRDETFGEDRCRVRRGHAPHVLASIRNIAVYLLDPQPDPSTAAAARRLAAKPHLALPWIGLADYTSE